MSENILLNLQHEPRFADIRVEHVKPAMQSAIAEARAQIAEIKAQSETTWQNTVESLTDITERVGRIWGWWRTSIRWWTHQNSARFTMN